MARVEQLFDYRSIMLMSVLFWLIGVNLLSQGYLLEQTDGPCGDMYRTTCKNVLKSRWTAAANQYERQVTKLLEDGASTPKMNSRPRLIQLRKLYKSCKDQGMYCKNKHEFVLSFKERSHTNAFISHIKDNELI